LPDLTGTCAADCEFWYTDGQTDMTQHTRANLETFVTNEPIKKREREKERGQEGEEVRHGNGKLWRKVRSSNTQIKQHNRKVK
jgi:hypothetical protein